MDILFAESRMNLNWNAILNQIKDDPEAFVNDGGWNFLTEEQNSSEDEEKEQSVQEDSNFEPSGVK